MDKKQIIKLYNNTMYRMEAMNLAREIASELDKNKVENINSIMNSIIHQIKDVIVLSVQGVEIKDIFSGAITEGEVNIPLVVERLNAVKPYEVFIDENGEGGFTSSQVEH
jgi:hypothetical protein